jgi:hypothetical protein
LEFTRRNKDASSPQRGRGFKVREIPAQDILKIITSLSPDLSHQGRGMKKGEIKTQISKIKTTNQK